MIINGISDPPIITSAVKTATGEVTVTFSAPLNNGGSAVTGYTVHSSPGDGTDINAGSTLLTHVVSGMLGIS